MYATVCKEHKINVLKCMYDTWARASRQIPYFVSGRIIPKLRHWSTDLPPAASKRDVEPIFAVSTKNDFAVKITLVVHWDGQLLLYLTGKDNSLSRCNSLSRGYFLVTLFVTL